jgi:hypothetical protein
MESGVLPEQLDPFSGEPVSVAPLTWSHATFVLTVEKYMAKFTELREREQETSKQGVLLETFFG